MDSTLTPDVRADLVEQQMTPEEKLQMILRLNGANANSPPRHISGPASPLFRSASPGITPIALNWAVAATALGGGEKGTWESRR